MSKKIGRPTKRTEELDESLVEYVANGQGIRAFCADFALSPTTVYSWLTDDAALSERVARARRALCLVLEEELQEIADTASTHVDDVQHRKLRCWAREKRLAWNDAARYGSKVQLGGAADLPPIKLNDTERAAKIDALLNTARERQKKTKEK